MISFHQNDTGWRFYAVNDVAMGSRKWHSPEERGDVGQIDPCPKAQGHLLFPVKWL